MLGKPTSVCWTATWNPQGVGVEHVFIDAGSADSVLVALDDDGAPFRLAYRLRWTSAGLLSEAHLAAWKAGRSRTLALYADGAGRWHDADGHRLAHLDGCLDIDIWPTPLTNSFPIWRTRAALGARHEYRMAWVAAPDLTVEAKPQAYTRVAERLYRFESLDGSGFQADLPVDPDGLVLDYPELFRRVATSAGPSASRASP